MGDAESVSKEVCFERHQNVNGRFDSMEKEIEETKSNIKTIQDAQNEYNRTLKNIYYSLLIIAFATILTLAGVILGRAVDFHIPL